MLIWGLLLFGGIFAECFYLFTALWGNSMYYIIGHFSITFVFFVIKSIIFPIWMCVEQISNEDYRWQWRSVLIGGSPAPYVFLYSILYYNIHMNVNNTVGGLMYFAYSFIIALCVFVVGGAIGFFSCNCLVSKMCPQPISTQEKMKVIFEEEEKLLPNKTKTEEEEKRENLIHNLKTMSFI